MVCSDTFAQRANFYIRGRKFCVAVEEDATTLEDGKPVPVVMTHPVLTSETVVGLMRKMLLEYPEIDMTQCDWEDIDFQEVY